MARDSVPFRFTLSRLRDRRKQVFSRVWGAVEPSLAPHLRRYARNFGLVQKSKEEMSIDMSLRATVQESLDNALSSDPLGDDVDFADEEAVQDMYSDVSSETLIII